MQFIVRRPVLAAVLTPFWALAGTVNAQNDDANTIDLALPGGIQADDLIMAQFMIRRTLGSSVTVPAGWTEIFSLGTGNLDASNPRQVLLQRNARGTASESGTINFTWARGNTSSTVTGMGRILVFRDVKTSDPAHEAGVWISDASGTDVSATMPDVTPLGSNRRCFAFNSILSPTVTIADPTGETTNNWTQETPQVLVTTPGNGGSLALFSADNEGAIAGGEAALGGTGENWGTYGLALIGKGAS